MIPQPRTAARPESARGGDEPRGPGSVADLDGPGGGRVGWWRGPGERDRSGRDDRPVLGPPDADRVGLARRRRGAVAPVVGAAALAPLERGADDEVGGHGLVAQ